MLKPEPVNLATKSIPGTKVVASKGVDNMPEPCFQPIRLPHAHVAAGKSEVTIAAPRESVQIVGCRLIFVNDGVERQSHLCAGSPDEKNWTTVGHATSVFRAGDRSVAGVPLPGAPRPNT